MNIGLLLFPDVTQLDLTGPFEVLARMPDARMHLIWRSLDPVVTHGPGLAILPTTTFATCPPLDLVCVPGGPGQVDLMQDREVLDFLRRQAQTCRYVTSVCTGSLILGAAGLLDGYRATSHWMSLDQLALLGAEPVRERVVVDRNRITGAGVTSGIDFGLFVVSRICGEATAKAIQLWMEYDPAPPYDAGSPSSADPYLVRQLTAEAECFQSKRRAATRKAADALRRRQEPN